MPRLLMDAGDLGRCSTTQSEEDAGSVTGGTGHKHSSMWGRLMTAYRMLSSGRIRVDKPPLEPPSPSAPPVASPLGSQTGFDWPTSHTGPAAGESGFRPSISNDNSAALWRGAGIEQNGASASAPTAASVASRAPKVTSGVPRVSSFAGAAASAAAAAANPIPSAFGSTFSSAGAVAANDAAVEPSGSQGDDGDGLEAIDSTFSTEGGIAAALSALAGLNFNMPMDDDYDVDDPHGLASGDGSGQTNSMRESATTGSIAAQNADGLPSMCSFYSTSSVPTLSTHVSRDVAAALADHVLPPVSEELPSVPEARVPSLPTVISKALVARGMGIYEIQMRESVKLDVVMDDDVVVNKDEVLGSGAMGLVYRGFFKGLPAAVKTVKLSVLGDVSECSQEDTDSFWHEVHIMARLKHPNVVTLYGACIRPPQLFLVEELMASSLAASIQKKQVSLQSLFTLSRDILSGLAYLHSLNVVHRDLKPENILMTEDGQAKIADFGLARGKYKTFLTLNAAGTVAYMAPECFDEESQGVTAKADMYSFGLILWELVTLARPWEGKNHANIIYQVFLKNARPALPAEGSERLAPRVRALIESCWQLDWKSRPTAAEALEELLAAERDGSFQAAA